MNQLNLFEYWNGFCRLRYIEVGPRRIGYNGQLLSSWRLRCLGENGPVLEEADMSKPGPKIVEFKERRFTPIPIDKMRERQRIMAEEDAKMFGIVDNIGE